jgi:DNA mismatch repair protein MutL
VGLIRELAPSVVEQIAAGEVVTRPASVLKELVENSLDAGAKKVDVFVANGTILVVDDGCGMDSEDAELAFRRHATSKISRAEDIWRVLTLGYRGEALAAIAAVSKVTLRTRRAEDLQGTEVRVEGGYLAFKGPCGCPAGTSVKVKDVFYNIPARRKHMGSASHEEALCVEAAERLALARPDVAFQVSTKRGLAFATPGDGRPESAVAAVCGGPVAASLVQVEEEGDGWRARALLVRDRSWADRSRQFVFVNGRPVRMSGLQSMLEEAWRGLLPSGRRPGFFVWAEVLPERVDVNVHPAKLEVAWADEAAAGEALLRAASEALRRRTWLVTDVRFHSDAGWASASEGRSDRSRAAGESLRLVSPGAEAAAEQLSLARACGPGPGGGPEPGVAAGAASVPPEEAEEPVRAAFRSEEAGGANVLRELEPMGWLPPTYVVARRGEALWLVDAHAAHERVVYERFRRAFLEGKGGSQALLSPLVLDAGPRLAALCSSRAEDLHRAGFEVEAFGGGAVAVRAVPSWLDGAGENAVREALEKVLAGVDADALLKEAAKQACHGVFRGGRALSVEEARALLADLSECGNPWGCPHGRPTAARLAREDLEALFARRLGRRAASGVSAG